MRTARVYTAVPWGAELKLGTVEVAIQRGLPDVRWVGLPARVAHEHGTRVRTALTAAGYSFPMGRISIKVTPASSLRSGYDLPIALAILTASDQLKPEKYLAFGELHFSGELLASPLTPSVAALAGQNELPWVAPCGELALTGAVGMIAGARWPRLNFARTVEKPQKTYAIDALQGNAGAKRVLALSLAGRHHLVLTGPPGFGKSVLAETAAELLPPLTQEEENSLTILESQRKQPGDRLPGVAPYRAPHHTITLPALLGGSNPFRPGELSLASYGVLFLDELPLCRREVTEALREPLETGVLRWGGLQAGFCLPACPILIAARNPCFCGNLGSDKACICTGSQRASYPTRVSIPLLERFPLHCELDKRDENDKQMTVGKRYSERVALVRRHEGEPDWTTGAKALLARAITQYELSYRAEYHIKSVARTITLFDDQEQVEEAAVHEALQYRVR